MAYFVTTSKSVCRWVWIGKGSDLDKVTAEAIARDLLAQHDRKQIFEPLKDRVPSVSDGYDVQDALVAGAAVGCAVGPALGPHAVRNRTTHTRIRETSISMC